MLPNRSVLGKKIANAAIKKPIQKIVEAVIQEIAVVMKNKWRGTKTKWHKSQGETDPLLLLAELRAALVAAKGLVCVCVFFFSSAPFRLKSSRAPQSPRFGSGLHPKDFLPSSLFRGTAENERCVKNTLSDCKDMLCTKIPITKGVDASARQCSGTSKEKLYSIHWVLRFFFLKHPTCGNFAI